MRSLILTAAAATFIVKAANAQHAGLPVLQPTITKLGTIKDTTVDWDPAISPRGNLIFYASSEGDLRMYNVARKTTTIMVRGEFWASWPVWSANGEVVAYSRPPEDGTRDDIYSLDIDPVTGAARGTPRRITTGGGESPSFSPDGKWLAYYAKGVRNDPAAELMVVPSNGGARRKLATGPLAIPPRWTPDGKWIYYATSEPQNVNVGQSKKYSVNRVSVDGGAAERIATEWGASPGLTPDGRFILMPTGPESDSLHNGVVTDAMGKPLASFTLPIALEMWNGWSGAYRFLAVRYDQPRALRVVSIDGGPSREVIGGALELREPAYSPDGRLIAAVDHADGRAHLLIMNADGTGVRRVPLKWESRHTEMHWSPNGRYIAFNYSPQTLNVYDVTTGTQRELAHARGISSNNMHWQSNSTTLNYMADTSSPVRPSDRVDITLHEVTIDGKHRAIRSFPLEVLSKDFRVPTGIQVYDSFAVSVGSNGFWIVPFDGAPRKIRQSGNTRTTLTPDGKTFVHGADVTGQRFKRLEVLGIDGTVVRSLPLPFEAYITPRSLHINITPDGKAAIIQGLEEGAKAVKLFRVPLDGAPPKAIATLPGMSRGELTVSPDGRSVLYTAPESPTSSFIQVDFTDALRRLAPSR